MFIHHGLQSSIGSGGVLSVAETSILNSSKGSAICCLCGMCIQKSAGITQSQKICGQGLGRSVYLCARCLSYEMVLASVYPFTLTLLVFCCGLRLCCPGFAFNAQANLMHLNFARGSVLEYTGTSQSISLPPFLV